MANPYYQRSLAPTAGDDILTFGHKRNYPDDEDNTHPEAFREGVFVKALVNARGGPNLLAVARSRQQLADPLFDPTWPVGQGEELKAMWDVTQHRVWERNWEADNARTPKMFTAPRWTGAQVLIDPLELERSVPDACNCIEVTRGVPLNNSLYQRVRYPAD